MWIYWFQTYRDQKNAYKQLKSLEEDWWVYFQEAPLEVQPFQTRNGQHGVKFILEE